MGSDSRAGAGNDIDSETDIGERSDTTILVHVSADRKTVYGVSLPRDAMVARPECEDDDGKTVPGADPVIFNAAFSLAGPTCTVAQVESLTGIYIDHYVTVDFNGFKDMVEAVHGVTVCIPEDVDDSAHGITFEAGTQELDGQQALDYVRERSSDAQRRHRPDEAAAGVRRLDDQQGGQRRHPHPARPASTPSSRPPPAPIVTDPDLASLSKLANLAYQFRKTDLDNITFITVPFEEYAPDPNRLIWSDSADGLWKVLLNDEPLPKRYREDVISARPDAGWQRPGRRPGSAVRARRPAPPLRRRPPPRRAATPAASRRRTRTASAPSVLSARQDTPGAGHRSVARGQEAGGGQDQHRPRHLLDAAPHLRAAQPPPQPLHGDDVEREPHQVEPREDQREEQCLRARRALVRGQELRKERHEEQRDLGVEGVGEEALPEVRRTSRPHCRLLVLVLVRYPRADGLAQHVDAQPEEVDRTDDLHHGERLGRGHQQGRQSDRCSPGVDGEAERAAAHGEHAAGATADEGVARDQCLVGSRQHDEEQGRDREGEHALDAAPDES